MRQRPAALVALVLVALAGCSAAGTAGPPGSSPPTPSATTTSPSPLPSPSPSEAADPTVPPAPTAVLADGAAELAPGVVGSWATADYATDAPWLPGAPVTIRSGADLRVGLGAPAATDTWTAAYVPIDDLQAIPEGLGEGRGEIAFAAPPGGHWSVLVHVELSGGGSAAFYWDVTVEEP